MITIPEPQIVGPGGHKPQFQSDKLSDEAASSLRLATVCNVVTWPTAANRIQAWPTICGFRPVARDLWIWDSVANDLWLWDSPGHSGPERYRCRKLGERFVALKLWLCGRLTQRFVALELWSCVRLAQ
jgi:hypothetical protein